MFCCGSKESIEDFFDGVDKSGEEVAGKSKKHEARPKSKKVGYVWGKGMPPIGNEFLGNDFGSLAKTFREEWTQVVGFVQKLK